jgi:hypothetical protein
MTSLCKDLLLPLGKKMVVAFACVTAMPNKNSPAADFAAILARELLISFGFNSLYFVSTPLFRFPGQPRLVRLVSGR